MSPQPTVGHCRDCGAVLWHHTPTNTWAPTSESARCRYGARAHTDVVASAAAGHAVAQGRTHVGSGNVIA